MEGFIKWDYRKGEKDTNLRLDFEYGDWASLWWNVWNNPNEWSSDVPKWRHGSIDFADWLLGAEKYICSNLESEGFTLHLPEKDYQVIVTEQFSTWTRPRFFGMRLPFRPFLKTRRSFDVDANKDPVPIPGKGENSWDCGDDAVYSQGMRAETAHEAASRFVDSIMKTRKDRGWKDGVRS